MTENNAEGIATTAHRVAVEAAVQGDQQEQVIEHPRYEKAIAALQRELDRRAEQARNDAELDAGERHRKINALYSHAQDLRGEIAKRYEAQLAEEAESHVQKLFYVTPINRDGVRSAYNDVHDRISFLREVGQFQEAREELERCWTRALRTGDKPLEIAVGQLAIEIDDPKLRDAYLSRSDAKRRAWDRYVTTAKQLENFRDPKERAWGAITGGFALLPPPEARGA